MHVENFSESVNAGHYDIEGPDGEIILPGVWDVVVEPGWTVTMLMWPEAEPRIEGLQDVRPSAEEIPPKPRNKSRQVAASLSSYFGKSSKKKDS